MYSSGQTSKGKKGEKKEKEKGGRACGLEGSGMHMPALLGGGLLFGGGDKAAADVGNQEKKKKGELGMKKRGVQQSEETRLIRAGVCNLALGQPRTC